MTTVKYGSTGEDVKKLQTLLNAQGYKLTVDGIFGAATTTAVKDYQTRKGLMSDGVVGEKTWAALNAIDPAQIVAQLRTALEDIEKLPSVKKLMEMI
jgi:peptidoglycan hydrolase-like protein with peptidoglycan-binding domain